MDSEGVNADYEEDLRQKPVQNRTKYDQMHELLVWQLVNHVLRYWSLIMLTRSSVCVSAENHVSSRRAVGYHSSVLLTLMLSAGYPLYRFCLKSFSGFLFHYVWEETSKKIL